MRLLSQIAESTGFDRAFAGREMQKLIALRASGPANDQLLINQQNGKVFRSTTMDELKPQDTDIVLESTAISVKEDIKLIRLQATITNSRDGDKSLDNIQIEAKKADKEAAYFALIEYVVSRAAAPVSRQVFRTVLQGNKPTYKKLSSIRHQFVFNDNDGQPINSYFITLIEV